MQIPPVDKASLLAQLTKAVTSGSNQFLSGGLVLMLVGGIVAWGRALPNKVWRWLVDRVTISVDVVNSDPAFAWLSAWLDAHPYARRSRRLSLTTQRNADGDPTEVLFTPAPGNHRFFYRGRFVWFNRDRKDTPGGKGEQNDGTQFMIPRETYHLRVLGRSQRVVRSLLEEARKIADVRALERPKIFLSRLGYWNELGPVPDREITSVVLPAGMEASLVDDVRWFLANRDWYRERGVPYRRGYALYGPPGTGKTSLISAIAHEFGFNVYVLSLASLSGDDVLFELLGYIRPNSVLLMEDIDVAVRGRQLKEGDDSGSTRGVTLSGLLNALDGVAAREGMLVFMTTNYPEHLDPALLRPGRVDVSVPFDFATADQAGRMYARFFEGEREALRFGDAVDELPHAVTMAEIQQHLLKHHADGHQALVTVHEIGAERIARIGADDT